MVEEDLKKTGYNKEEEYFYKLNRQLIEKKRTELDAQRAEQERHAQVAQYWMKCPKCGHQMKEIDLQGIKVDRCTQCSGIYFDRGELELLLQSQEPKGFLSSLKKLFR
jgi:acetyl-CoA carboxylase beta subunit